MMISKAHNTPHLRKAHNEKRMFLKQITNNNADLTPDLKSNTLTITLHFLSAPRYNRAAQQLAILLKKTETIFPGSNLRMIFKPTAVLNCERQGGLNLGDKKLVT